MAKPFQPTNFGRYQLVDRIALGGMAEIFVAKIFGAMGFEKQVVIKRILPQFAEDSEFLRMFVTEAKLVCHLEHPNIVQVSELGEHDGQYFIAMEWVNGIDGGQMWRALARRQQRLPALLALYIVSEVLKGLDYAHRAIGPDNRLLGVVHRDVSPSNVMISFRGDVKIGDFGVALVQQESKTQAGVLKGKYGYMSPEQVAGLPVDHRSDIFAAGIVLCELMLGRRLFLGRSDFETLDKVLNVRLDVLDQHEAALPADAVAIVRRVLQRRPEDRYASAREFHEAIVDHLLRQPQRVTSDALGTFIAQHVAPHVEARDGERSGSDTSSKRAHAGAPRMPSPEELVPRDLARPPSPGKGASARAVGRDLEAELSEDRFGAPAFSWDAPTVDRALEAVSTSSWPEQGEIDLSGDEDDPLTAPGPTFPGYQQPGVGEELDLSYDEEMYYLEPGTIEPRRDATGFGSAEGSFAEGSFADDRASGADSAEAWPMLQVQLTPAVDLEAEELRQKPDFAGQLSHRTVIKVLFRFAVVSETGLLTLTGPEGDDVAQTEALGWLRDLRATGTLVQDCRTCEIHLEEGAPHLVAADRSEEALVAHLLATDQLERHRVEKALRGHRHRSTVAALLADGLLAPLQLSRHLTGFVVKSVVDSFAWTEGDFAFYRGAGCSQEAFPTGLDALELVWQGALAVRRETLEAYFGRIAGRRVGVNPAAPRRIESFPPEQLLHGAYEVFREPRQLEEALVTCAGLGPMLELERALYTLIECELLTVE